MVRAHVRKEVKQPRPVRRVVHGRRRVVQKRKTPWLFKVFILMGLIAFFAVSWQEMEEKAISEKYNAALAALDKVSLGCKVYWDERGLYKRCSQTIVNKFFDSNTKDVQVTVIQDRKRDFLVRARHLETDKVFQLDGKGDIYLNVKGCLAKVNYVELSTEDVMDLEKQCGVTHP